MFGQVAKRKGVKPLLDDIKAKLEIENVEAFLLIIHREQPDFFPEHYMENEDFSINAQLSNHLGCTPAVYLIEKGIRNLHLELFGERDLEQEFKNKGWK